MEMCRSLPDGTLVLVLQESIYSKTTILKTCYLFTDRCYLMVRRLNEAAIEIHLAGKEASVDLKTVCGEFCNELIDQQVRADISSESGKIRELIVAQAFAEGDLIDSVSTAVDDTDHVGDPLRIVDSSDGKEP